MSLSATESDLKGKKRDELSAMCKERNLPYSGVKAALIARLLGLPKPETAAKKKAAAPKPPSEPPKCFNIISEKFLLARQNEHGNFEDPITHFVFDRETKQVVGRQTGPSVGKLSMNDVRLCRKKGLDFRADVFDGNFASKEEDIEVVVEKLIAESNENDSGDDDEPAE